MPKEYFESHGMSYPVDVSGVSIFAVKYAGINDDEMMEPGAREFVEEGIMFAKVYLERNGVKRIIPDISAISADKPVLFRGTEGEVGLMIRITAFGSGEPDSRNTLPIEFIVEKNKMWKFVNFAYFNRDGLYNWRYGGLVF